jgi:pantoate--beta-alanine ligase
MGNLHAGHLSLVDLARRHADRIVVSIFVNPTQFGPGEDIASYPRTPDEDRAALEAHGEADLLFSPAEAEVYPLGLADRTTVSLPKLADDLCGRTRPGHFNGVGSVVLRLVNVVRPDVLVVGSKDYQQMILLERMIEDLHLGVELVAGVIVREADGLAMSSRNQYLTATERKAAPALAAALRDVAAGLGDDPQNFVTRRAAAIAALGQKGFRVDYLELRNAADLSRIDAAGRDGQRVLLAAAWLGRARLIDNLLLPR